MWKEMDFLLSRSGQLTAVLREIRLSGLFFFEISSAFLKKNQTGANTF
jgi:hypothetical protein